MSVVRNVDLDDAARGCDSVEFLHHLLETIKGSANVLKHVLHQDVVKAVVFKGPRELLDVQKNVGVAGWEAIGIDKAFTLIKAAA